MERHIYLEVMLMEVEQMDEGSFQPPAKVLKQDEVIGEASVYTRKLWATAQYYAKHVEELAVEARYSQPSEAKKMGPQIFEAAQKRDVLAALAWMCARADAGWWESNIGIRREWKIVKPNMANQQGFFDKIKGYFGQEAEPEDD